MGFDDDLVALISSRTEFTLADGKPWPLILPEHGNRPAIVYQGVSDDLLLAHDGYSGYRTERVQFSFLATTLSGSIDLKDAFEGVFAGFSAVYGNTDFNLWELVNSRPSPAAIDDQHYMIQDYMISHRPV